MNCDLTIYDEQEDEFFPATLGFSIETDILDENHPYITILKEE